MDISRKSPITILISKNPILPSDNSVLPDIIRFSESRFGPNSCFATVITTNNPVDNFDFAFYQNQPVVVLLDHYKEDNLANSIDSQFTLKACNASPFCVYKSKNSAILFQPKFLFIISDKIEVFSSYCHRLLNYKHNIRILFVTNKDFTKTYYFVLNSTLNDYSALDFHKTTIDNIEHIRNPVIRPPYFIENIAFYSFSKHLSPIEFIPYLNDQF